MTIWIRFTVAVGACLLAGVLGWWWQRPASAAGSPPAAQAPRLPDTASASPGTSDDALAKQVSAMDPFGLARTTALAPGTAGPAASATEAITWHFAALVVRGKERYLVMTAANQTPQKLNVGERLPDGSRIKAIEPDHAVIQGTRGRTSKIYLTEP